MNNILTTILTVFGIAAVVGISLAFVVEKVRNKK